VQTWAQNTALEAFTIWDASPDNEDNKASEFYPLKIKPKRGNIIDFISKAREWLGSGDLLKVYLQARANAVGLNCDSTMRNHKQVKRHLKRCRKCVGGHNETLIHVWLRCPGHTQARSPLIRAIADLSPPEKQIWVQCTSETETMHHILRATSESITRVAIECLRQMLQELESYK
jgi:hypothetical protein